jgi:hypothetical protein
MQEADKERPIFRLPGSIPTPREVLRLVPASIHADFVSQVLVSRHAVPDDDPRLITEQAVTAYDKGARIAVRRMPAGYRKTIVT